MAVAVAVGPLARKKETRRKKKERCSRGGLRAKKLRVHFRRPRGGERVRAPAPASTLAATKAA